MAKPKYSKKGDTLKTHRNNYQIKDLRKYVTVTADNQYIVYTKYYPVQKYKKVYFSFCKNPEQIHLKKAENNPQWHKLKRKIIISTNPGEIFHIEPDEGAMSIIEHSESTSSQENGGHTNYEEEDTDGDYDSENFDENYSNQTSTASEEELSVLTSDPVAIESTTDVDVDDNVKYNIKSHLIDSDNDQRVLNRVLQEEEREWELVADNTYHQHSFNVSCTLIIVGIVASIIFVIIRTKQMASFMKKLSLQTVNK